MVRTKEGGSVPGFVIVGIILVALLAGGVFWLRQQAKQGEAPPQVPQQPIETPAQPSQPVEPSRPENRNAEGSSSAPVSQTPVGASLPQTGPEDTLLGSVIAGILAGVLISYVRSRREVTAF